MGRFCGARVIRPRSLKILASGAIEGVCMPSLRIWSCTLIGPWSQPASSVDLRMVTAWS